MVQQKIVATRSEAESWIKLGRVSVDGKLVTKAGELVADSANIKLNAPERYVSRAGLKLASVAKALNVDFKGKVVLDVGSSTGGFTDYALQHGAKKVIAVDVGTDQMHPSLRGESRVELHEKTDIRRVEIWNTGHARSEEWNMKNGKREVAWGEKVYISQAPDIVLIDVSFISLREILPHISNILPPTVHRPMSTVQPPPSTVYRPTSIIAMVKPQFEAGKGQLGSSGVVKNDSVRRQILKSFEIWAKQYFIVQNKADSQVSGASGNLERFYLLQKIVVK